ncbi:MAG: helix-turn-helix transcriptional regulator [Clostridia bacterium]|nr:helix-turn-helix transcriptional regulator [Clostridia bacterium]
MKLLRFAENLRTALKAHDMTQQELADHISTTQATVNRWLKGINEPDLATLLEICLYLDETPNAILGYDDITENDFLAYRQAPENVEESRKRLVIATYEDDYDDSDDE